MINDGSWTLTLKEICQWLKGKLRQTGNLEKQITAQAFSPIPRMQLLPSNAVRQCAWESLHLTSQLENDPSANPVWSGVTCWWNSDPCAFNLIDDFDSDLLIPTCFHWCSSSCISIMTWSADVLLRAMLQVSSAASCAWSEKTVTLQRSPACRIDGHEV